MSTLAFPTIEIRLEGMRQSMLSAFLNHQKDVAKGVEAALEEAVTNFDFAAVVRKEAQTILRAAIEESVKKAVWKGLEDPEVTTFISTEVQASLLKVLKEKF